MKMIQRKHVVIVGLFMALALAAYLGSRAFFHNKAGNSAKEAASRDSTTNISSKTSSYQASPTGSNIGKKGDNSSSSGMALTNQGMSSVKELRAQVQNGSYGKIPIQQLLDFVLSNNFQGSELLDMRMALLVRKQDVVPELKKRLVDKATKNKYEVLSLIQGQLRWAELSPDMLTLMSEKDASEDVRGRASIILAMMGKSEAIPDMRDFLSGARETPARMMTATALGLLGDSDSEKQLSAMLADKSPEVRAAAAGAMGMLGKDDGLREALRLSSDDSPAVRVQALRALSYIPAQQAADRLREIAETDSDYTMRNEAAEQLGRRELDAMTPQAALAWLKNNLKPTDQHPPQWAFVYLAENCGEMGKEFLTELADTDAGPLKTASELALLQMESGFTPTPKPARR